MNNIEILSKLLKEKSLTLGSIESLTGGLFASEMTSIPGASSIFKGAIVTYMTEEKVRLLGASKDIIEDQGVVSHEMAKEMASKGLIKLASSLTVSFTGNAGPDVMENKPCGTVYIGVASKDDVISKAYQFKGDRNSIRMQCVEEGAKLLIDYINKK